MWNTDVKAGLHGIQAALKAPMPHGSRVLIASSGAAQVNVPPESLRLSGGNVGAKRMLWLMAHYANSAAGRLIAGVAGGMSALFRLLEQRRLSLAPSAIPRGG